MVGAALPLSFTWGAFAGGAVTCPETVESCGTDCTMSSTNTTVSSLPTPSAVDPWAPNPADGGATTTSRLPTFLPCTLTSNAGTSCPLPAWYSCGLPPES